ncbi:MAG: carboxy terminal-processing peptidase [Ferruginibacter sp.]|nr:carboxy terminal-processing peptidase [Chitinophagaceae bacterium]
MKTLTCLIIYLFIFSGNLAVRAQHSPAQQQAITLKRQVERNHYSPRAVDDSFSSAVFTFFIKQLDRQQDVFTADDYKALSSFRYSLDDELNNGNWKFLDLATQLYKKALQREDSIIKEILQKPLDFTPDEKIVFTKAESTVFAKDTKELRLKWIKWFKYIMLRGAWNMASADSTHPSLKVVLTKNEITIREKIRKAQVKVFLELLDPSSFENDVKETYLNAITASFDPHSGFLSPREKEDFQSDLSSEEFSFGFEIDETEEGKIFIALLVPGGPAWKTGEIHKNDELLQLQWKGNTVVDISTVTIDEVDDLLAKSNHDELTIKVKKQNGTVRTVVLRKEKIETEQDVVKGYLLSGEKKIGYISLPDFYTTWDDEKGSGCANDMAKEIILMKKENLDGLILDVRYNGGGSVYEALQLCGIFIDEGPLVGTKRKDGKLVFEKDPNRGTIYDGPLVVLVNNQSASASELLAAALQDYNRAVIAGSPTYGKATMQQIFPVDSNGTVKSTSPNGFARITTGKLYRVTGETAQRNGVIPDILLPDAFDGLEYREKFMPHALPADTVKKNSYFKPMSALPVAALAAASTVRVNNSESFRQLVQAIKRRTTEKAAGRTSIPLQPAAFEIWIKEREANSKAMDEKEETENKKFTTGNYRAEKERLQNNAYAAELNAAALKSIQKDMYVQEAFGIITDLINLQKK